MNDVAAKLALPAGALLVIGIAYTLANSAWYFLTPPTTEPVAREAPATRAGPARAPDLNAIVARNLFGAADATADQAPVEEPTVVTRLPLELLGVFVAEDPDSSSAIISQRGRPGLLYDIGDEVPGNATLVDVQRSHVVLRRAGSRETLPFPAPGEGVAARNSQMSIESVDDTFPDVMDEFPEEPGADYEEIGAADLDEQGVQELIDEYRQELEANPEGTLESLGVAPVSEGAAEGYRVGNLAQSPYLSQTGLQPGDVILSVNGRPVGDLNADRLELANVLAQGSARLEVQRGSRRFFVTASLQ